MKNLLLLLLMSAPFTALFAQDNAETPPFTMPLVDGKFINEKVVEVDNKSKLSIYTRVTSWYYDQFKDEKSKLTTHDPEIGQIVANVQEDVDDVIYMNYTLQIDCKDNKYRYRITNLRSTVKGKENTPFFAKYLVNVPVETDNEIVLGLKKGYGKGQKKTIENRLFAMNSIINKHIESLNRSINVKAEEF